ncbi:hypothetical protein [Methylophaga sulfidovorans]|uniref:Uncharacterized protein n=1 Tax=Methylophaga sulfidovorans TaxID=45496 RepID=A0A1I4AME5_9GAMM|nr:hypothetical protein [Methylophaga sulfidovorans]SFK57081.1 hypothetical protein SAMN04488079_1153 [Methylophaga sulfidovorans]
MKTHGFIYLFIGLVSCLGLLLAFVWGIEVGFSVSQDEYERNIIPVLSVLGTWVGAFATCSAVLLSLWLAFRQINQDKEILDCRLDMNLIPGYQNEPCIGLTVVSKGNKPANILSLSWFGEGAKTAIWVARFNQHSETLPKVLSYGQQINLMHVPHFERDLAKYVREHMDGKFENLYLSLNTTTGSTKVKVKESMLSLIKSSESANK